jgi:hypothetical protein
MKLFEKVLLTEGNIQVCNVFLFILMPTIEEKKKKKEEIENR